MYVFIPEKQAGFKKLVSVMDAFTPEECAKICALFTSPVDAGVHESNLKNQNVRKSKICWLYYKDAERWIFDRLWKIATKVNQSAYNFQLTGFLEALQLTHYESGDFYNWHEDSTEPAHTTRKLSLVVQLSEEKTYTGGELIVWPNHRAPRAQGSVSFFPSFLTHRAAQVTHGERFSLVAWVTGEPFR